VIVHMNFETTSLCKNQSSLKTVISAEKSSGAELLSPKKTPPSTFEQAQSNVKDRNDVSIANLGQNSVADSSPPLLLVRFNLNRAQKLR